MLTQTDCIRRLLVVQAGQRLKIHLITPRQYRQRFPSLHNMIGANTGNAQIHAGNKGIRRLQIVDFNQFTNGHTATPRQ